MYCFSSYAARTYCGLDPFAAFTISTMETELAFWSLEPSPLQAWQILGKDVSAWSVLVSGLQTWGD